GRAAAIRRAAGERPAARQRTARGHGQQAAAVGCFFLVRVVSGGERAAGPVQYAVQAVAAVDERARLMRRDCVQAVLLARVDQRDIGVVVARPRITASGVGVVAAAPAQGQRLVATALALDAEALGGARYHGA